MSGRALLEALSDAVVVTDASSRIVLLNPAAQRLFDYAADALRGERMDVILAGVNTCDGLQLADASPIGGPGVGAYECVRGRRRSGDEFWVEVSATTALQENSGHVWLLRELAVESSVSEGRAPTPALRQLEGATVGIVRLNSCGEITYMNDVARRFVEVNREHDSTCVGLGQNYLHACDQSPQAWGRVVSDGLRGVLAGKSDFFDTVYSCHSPSRLCWIRLQARRPPDESRAIVLTHIDCTAQRLTEARTRIQSCVAEAFTKRRSLVAACSELAQIVCQELQWDYLGVWLPSAETWKLSCVDSWTRPGLPCPELHELLLKTQLDPGQGLPGRVWQSRKAEWLAAESNTEVDANTGTRLPRTAIAAGFRSGFAFSVRYDEDVLAVV
jgi:PAS domain S-box-containing protein